MSGAYLTCDLQKLRYIPYPSMKQSIHESVQPRPPTDQIPHTLPEQTPVIALYPHHTQERFYQNNSAHTGDNQEKILST